MRRWASVAETSEGVSAAAIATDLIQRMIEPPGQVVVIGWARNAARYQGTDCTVNEKETEKINGV